jgi:hypothetical protein
MSTTLTHCRNCGHRLFAWDQFCSQCGQDTLDHPPTLWEFIHEWVLHYLAFEGKLWKSLWGLIAKPGFLTLEYLAGRKQRYVLPLRLVLTLGLLFFVAIKLFPPGNQAISMTPPKPGELVAPVRVAVPVAASAAEAAASKALSGKRRKQAEPQDPAQVMQEALQSEEAFNLSDDLRKILPDGAQRTMNEANARWKADPGAEMRRIGSKVLAMAPYAVLLSLPFFAGLLKLLYWRLAYGAHFVFAMHLHAAWYLMLLVVTLLPWGFVHAAVWFWSNLYPLLALKRVHRAGWASTLAKATLLVLMHWVLIGIGLTLLLLVGALSA